MSLLANGFIRNDAHWLRNGVFSSYDLVYLILFVLLVLLSYTCLCYWNDLILFLHIVPQKLHWEPEITLN
jgi:hypothetical protein